MPPAPESGSGVAEEAVKDLAGGEPGEAGVDQHVVLALVDAIVANGPGFGSPCGPCCTKTLRMGTVPLYRLDLSRSAATVSSAVTDGNSVGILLMAAMMAGRNRCCTHLGGQ
jgi:hypothetical protein